MRTARIAVRLAFADLWAERVLGLCTVLGLAAVLAPLVVLAGLRAGVVEGLRQLLLEDPHAREIVTAANRSFEAALLTRLAARPDVQFLAPRTRTLAASLVLQRAEGAATARVELLPTAPGDPLIPPPPPHAPPLRADQIVLTAAAAARLQAGPGDALVGRLVRDRNGQRQSVALALRVAAVAPPAAFAREAAFVPLALAVLVEDYQDGLAEAPAALDRLGPPARATFAGFRLYARKLEDVPVLDAMLRAAGIDVVSRAGDVASLLAVDRNLGVLFLLVSGLGGAGFLVSLGAGLWANVERKRVALALMRFLGLRRAGLSVFPVVQAGAMALAGAGLGVLAALAAAMVVNTALAGTLAIDHALCMISPWTGFTAVAVTLAGAVLVAGAASLRAAGIEPWEGVSAP